MIALFLNRAGFSALQRAEIAEILSYSRLYDCNDYVSVLFNEPKLLKCERRAKRDVAVRGFSALQRAEIAEIEMRRILPKYEICFSALQRAEIAEISRARSSSFKQSRFSALQRAEIAEIKDRLPELVARLGFSALQRAEIAEIPSPYILLCHKDKSFSALQRAEIAEIRFGPRVGHWCYLVSVLFNEPKLLKYRLSDIARSRSGTCFSALQRAEIAEITGGEYVRFELQCSFSALQRAEIAEIKDYVDNFLKMLYKFQCSSTSRNC